MTFKDGTSVAISSLPLDNNYTIGYDCDFHRVNAIYNYSKEHPEAFRHIGEYFAVSFLPYLGMSHSLSYLAAARSSLDSILVGLTSLKELGIDLTGSYNCIVNRVRQLSFGNKNYDKINWISYLK